jgi:hypothetical protein
MTTPARTTAPPVSVPWPLAELIRVYALNSAALIAVLAAWWGASGTVRNSSQVMAIAVAVTAVVVSGSGNAIWVMVGRRAVGVRRTELRERLSNFVAALEDRVPTDEADYATLPPALVTLANATRYHRSDCELVAGKPAIAWSPGGNGVDGRAPCGVCRP